jgi:hypothetical protein
MEYSDAYNYRFKFPKSKYVCISSTEKQGRASWPSQSNLEINLV